MTTWRSSDSAFYSGWMSASLYESHILVSLNGLLSPVVTSDFFKNGYAYFNCH